MAAALERLDDGFKDDGDRVAHTPRPIADALGGQSRHDGLLLSRWETGKIRGPRLSTGLRQLRSSRVRADRVVTRPWRGSGPNTASPGWPIFQPVIRSRSVRARSRRRDARRSLARLSRFATGLSQREMAASGPFGHRDRPCQRGRYRGPSQTLGPLAGPLER